MALSCAMVAVASASCLMTDQVASTSRAAAAYEWVSSWSSRYASCLSRSFTATVFAMCDGSGGGLDAR